MFVQDICKKLNIDVNICDPKCESFQDLKSPDDTQGSIIFPIFLTVRKMIGLETEFSLNEVDGIVGNILRKIKIIESVSSSSESDTDEDAFIAKEDNKRLKMDQQKLEMGLRKLGEKIANRRLNH